MRTLAAVCLLAALAASQDKPPWHDNPRHQEGERLWKQGVALLQQGKPAEARKLFLEASAIYDEVPAPPDGAYIHSFIARSYEAEHRYADAMRHCEEFLRRARGIDKKIVVTALLQLGDTLRQAGSSNRACDVGAEVLNLCRRMHRSDHGDTSIALNNLAFALLDAGRAKEALDVAEQAVSMRRRLLKGDHPWVAASMEAEAQALQWLGRLEDSLARHREVLAMRRRLFGEDHEMTLTSLNNIGLCLTHLDRPEAALPLLQRVVETRERRYGGDDPDLATSISNLAQCRQRLGRPREACTGFERALAMKKRLFAGDHAHVAIGLRLYGAALMVCGRHAEARPLLEESLAMWRRLFEGDHRGKTAAINDLAVCLGYLGETKKSIPLFEEAIAITRRCFGEHPDLVTSLRSLALGLEYSGRTKDARARYEEALTMARRVAPLRVHESATVFAWFLLGQGELDEAARLFAESTGALELRRTRSRSLDEIARALYAERAGRFDAFGGLAEVELQRGRATEALRALERGRARAMLDLLERSRFDPLAEAERRARTRKDDRLVARIEAVRKALARDPASKKALGERARLVQEIVPIGRPAAPEEIQAALGKGERLLYYAFTMHGALLLFVPPPGEAIRGFGLQRPRGGRLRLGDVDAEVRRYVDLLARGAGSVRGLGKPEQTTEAAPRAALLYAALIPKEIRAELADASRVYIVPHGPLHLLPFESLVVDGKQRTWLEAGPPVAYAHSGSVGLWCRRRRDDQRRGGQRYEVVALGDAAFAAELPPLPGTRREVESIRRALKDASVAVLERDAATKERLHELAPQGRFLHLATHALADEREQRGYSRLVLTGGSLSLFDLFEHWRDRLSGCELVVLSACATNKGPLQRDEGLYAMPLGFLYAGAPAVIGSLWQVDDASTAELFAAFYERLAKGEGKLEAFTAARRKLRERNGAPYYWAPFVYIGDPR